MLVGTLVRLRPLEEFDLAKLAGWRNKPDVWVNFFNKFPISPAGQKAWFTRLIDDRQRLLFVLEPLDTAEAIGTVGLDHIDPYSQCAEYGNIVIGEAKYLGRGMAADATAALLTYGFKRLNLNRIYLHVLEENEKARKLYERCGFRPEGLLREAFYDEGRFKNIVVMAILRKEHGV